MRKKVMFGVVLGLLMSMSGIAAHAQDGSKVDLFVGYSYLLSHTNSNNSVGNHGYDFAATWNFNRHIGLEANISGNHGTTTTEEFKDGTFVQRSIEKADTTTFLFGPKLSYPVMSNFSVFTHFLVGAAHVRRNFQESCCTTTSTLDSSSGKGTGFGMKVGGGLDWNHGRFGIRILEVDYVHGGGESTFFCSDCEESATATDRGTSTFAGSQLSTGITIHFGGTN